MAYMTIQEFLIKYDPQLTGRRTDDYGDSEIIDSTIQIFLDDASDLIDSYLRRRFVLPLTGTHNSLRRACGIIANHDLERRKTRGDGNESDPEYDSVIEWLTTIGTGDITLDNETIRSDISAYMSSQTAIFTETSFENF